MAVWKEHCEISKVVNFETTLLNVRFCKLGGHANPNTNPNPNQLK